MYSRGVHREGWSLVPAGGTGNLLPGTPCRADHNEFVLAETRAISGVRRAEIEWRTGPWQYTDAYRIISSAIYGLCQNMFNFDQGE